MNVPRRVLVLGANGMLGHAVLRLFAARDRYDVIGTVRSEGALKHIPAELHKRVRIGIDVSNFGTVEQLFIESRPDVVVNCVGLVKQLATANDPLAVLPINSLLPHHLSRLCALGDARLVHVSTDCVFSGRRGDYRESDPPDGEELYGRSKLLGEVIAPHAVTLRTSIIGPELAGAHGLIGWFLSQHGSVRGFTRAIFSGLPTVELARVLHDVVLPATDLSGLYHLSAAPIAKFDLLHLVAREYGKSIEIVPDDSLVIDRSLDSTRFRAATGYAPAAWPDLVHAMREFG